MQKWKNKLSPKKFRNQDEKFKRKLGKWLNYTTVILMLVAFLLCAGFGHLFDLILTKFDNNPILNATFAFKKSGTHSMLRTPRDLTIPQEIPNPPIPTLKNATAKLKNLKIKHTFSVVGANRDKIFEEIQDDPEQNVSTVNEKDEIFIKEFQIDLRHTQWGPHSLTNFMIALPFLSEIVAIIWTVMLLTYQSGSKRIWTIPDPWRIVVPSLILFFIMSVCSITFTALYVTKIAQFCIELKKGLQEPDIVTCGKAISTFKLRELPSYRQKYSDDIVLSLLQFCSFSQTICWVCSFLIMLFRFIFAVDFQLIEMNIMTNRELEEGIILRNSISVASEQTPSPKPRFKSGIDEIDTKKLNASEDEDYYSTRSRQTLESQQASESLEMSSLQPLLKNDENSKSE